MQATPADPVPTSEQPPPAEAALPEPGVAAEPPPVPSVMPSATPTATPVAQPVAAAPVQAAPAPAPAPGGESAADKARQLVALGLDDATIAGATGLDPSVVALLRTAA